MPHKTAKQPSFERNAVMAMLGVNLMVLTATLDMSIVNVSLPTLVKALNTDFPTVEWVILSYILVIACLLLLISRLGDMRGKKKIFSAGLVVFTAGSLMCGASPSIGWLIASRAVQGVGAAMSQALGIAIITEIAPPAMRGRAIGIVGATVAVGLSLGPSLGGLLIDLAGWRFIFLINVPVCLAAYAIVRRYLPDLPPVLTDQRFDIPGALVIFVTLGCYSLGMTLAQRMDFSNPLPASLLTVAALGFLAFILVELRVKDPMLDLTLFKNTLFSLNLLMGVMVFLSLSGGFILPFLLQTAQGYSVRQVGLLMMVVPVCMGLVSPKAGALSDRFGSRGICLLGLFILSGGCFATSSLTLDSPWWVFALCQAPIGLGAGIFQAPNNSAIMGAVPPERLGVASGLLNYSRIFGQTSGLPLIGVIFASIVAASANLPPHAEFISAPAEALAQGVTGAYRIQAFMLLATTIPAIASIIVARRKRA
jgi:EmrB/QacA subfamily drug resistance transporter